MVSPKEIDWRKGIYGGWGNFGSCLFALTMVIVGGLAFRCRRSSDR